MTDPGGTTRRTFIVGALAAAAGGSLLAACGGDDDGGGSEASAESGPWSFRDDRGTTIRRESRPERIVAYDTAASALLYLGVKPIAVFGSAPLKGNYLFDDHDTSGITEIGTNYGEINLEKLASLRPDLIVAPFNPEQEAPFGFKDTAQLSKATKFAPLAAINGVRLPTQVIAGFEKLATSLGADQDAAARKTEREAFDAAVEELGAAAQAKPGITVMAVAPLEDAFYVAKPQAFPALHQYKQWGVTFLEPGGKDEFWDTLSYENADRYQTDLIMRDTMVDALDLKDLQRKPAWRNLEAVKTGRLVPWTKLESWSYPLYTTEIEGLAKGLRDAATKS